MKPRGKLFDQLPADLNDFILSRMPLRDVMAMRLTRPTARDAVDSYLEKLCQINNIAKYSRADTAYLLQGIYAPDSRKFKDLQTAALSENASDEVYALYALVANVTTLDPAKLLQVINSLREKQCSERILTSLNIIHHYLTHGNDFDRELTMLLESAGNAYINLRGANLMANFHEVDLSHADLRETGFHALVSGASLEGANLSGATFSDRTIFSKTTNARGMILDGVNLGGCVVESEEDPVTHVITYDVPELEPLVRALAEQAEAARKKDGGCNIL